ncbi:hypothetical protein [Streptomyces achromogenes]|uniref:hypothetical protein n=1 Tax=Streptomyces achromogenes TaxID=67255 RepID=UPI003695CD4E
MDWAALEAAHAQEPLPHGQDIVRLDGVPEDVRLRHAALLPEPGPDGLPGGAGLTRERARHGLGSHLHCAPTTQLDGPLRAGLLDGADLARLAAPAARLLAYLGAAARRTDALPEIAEARALLAGLVRTGLGTDPAAWHGVARRLTDLDPEWNPITTAEALLAAQQGCVGPGVTPPGRGRWQAVRSWGPARGVSRTSSPGYPNVRVGVMAYAAVRAAALSLVPGVERPLSPWGYQ